MTRLQIPQAHVEELMAAWNRLVHALEKYPPKSKMELFAIHDADIKKAVLEVLAPSWERLSIEWLTLNGNDMDNDCISIITKIIERNSSIELFDCEHNRPVDITVN
mmetsp:Transcript_9673/g.15861  ORF Transcript_9673/g.15861 Transcript_9673/m.15861 type:complete len:106 (+) Transcript_9673:78-395(+)